MAYLSDEQTQDQQNSQQGQSNFNILAPASSATSGGSQQGGGGGSYSSIQSGTQAAPDQNGQTADTSNRNAQNYTQSLSGTTGTSSPNTQTNIHQPASSVIGLGSSTPGGGYINFSSYANANPSTASQIAAGGQRLISDETNALNTATNADPNSGFSTATNGAPTSSTNLSDISNLLSENGNDWANAQKNLSGWLNESYTAPSASYSPSQEWQTAAPELSQTGILGSSANSPSVIDYLAQPDIAAGNYSNGERSLDQSLIAGDPAAQNAIQQNAINFGNFQTNAGNTIAGLQNQFNTNQTLADTIKNSTSSALNNYQNLLNNDIASSQQNRKNFLSSEEANLDKAHPGFASQINSWLENQSGLAPSAVTPGVALQANHLADVLGNPEPYSDPNNPTNATQSLTPAQNAAQAASYGLTGVEMQGLGLTPPSGTTWAAPPVVDSSVPQPFGPPNEAAALKDQNPSGYTPPQGWEWMFL